MYSRAALRSVQAQASLGLGVVCNLRPPVGLDRCIRFTGSYNLNAARPQQRTQPHAHRQCEGLFELAAGKSSAGIVATVGRIQYHNKSRWWGCR